MKIPVIFLGTGQAIPTARRNHTAIFIKYKDENLLFDCGEGTQRQFRKAKQNLCKVNRLLITHWHGDHILGIPGMLQTLQLNKCSHTLYVYGPKGTKKFMNEIQKLFVHEGKLKLKVEEISSGKVFETSDFSVQALPMKHRAPCLAYFFQEKDRLRINKNKIKKLKLPGKLLGELARGRNVKYKKRIIKASRVTYKQKGKKIAIIMDTAINPNCYKIAKNADLLISEAVYSEKEKNLAKEYKHLTTTQAARIAKKSKVKKLVLAHLSQRYEKEGISIFFETRKVFKNIGVAEDLDTLEI